MIARLPGGLHPGDLALDGRQLAFKHEELADMLGVQRTSVTLAARTLQSSGLIRYTRGVIFVLDADRLEHAACECYGVVKRESDRLLPNTIAT